MGCFEMVAIAILTILASFISLFVWFWISYRVLDNEKIPFGVAIAIVMIISALLGVEFYFLINTIII